jgi:cysteinyl-tRNA synthetase
VEEGKVKMYVCGPTVYDVPHIGHARSAYVFDIIRRYFEYTGHDVYFVRNVTDIDDKIIKKAAAELQETDANMSSNRLKERAAEVAVRYLDIYHEQLGIFGIQLPTIEPKATEYISQMIEFIETLLEKEYAYVVGENVYFSVKKFNGYGKLSNQDREQMMHGVRIGLDEKKRYPLDFALWKEAKPEEPSWKSPWGDGRPGWHIECSVMSTGILGTRFDIHGGGLDLIFPHHENEIAQAEAITGENFANYWMHNGLLTVNGEKMSKSLGNYITIADFLEKYRDPDLLKMAFLASHYRSPMDYSDEKMDEISRAKERLITFMKKVNAPGSRGAKKAPDTAKAERATKKVRDRFSKAMDDDFNTPIAMSAIFDAVYDGNIWIEKGNIPAAGLFRDCVKEFADVLGLSLVSAEVDEKERREIEELVTRREKARKKKDYAASDRIRQELADKSVVVEDTAEGPVWRKK